MPQLSESSQALCVYVWPDTTKLEAIRVQPVVTPASIVQVRQQTVRLVLIPINAISQPTPALAILAILIMVPDSVQRVTQPARPVQVLPPIAFPAIHPN